MVNCSIPSRKNGRFSEKKSSFRGSNWNWPSSDSTCEKSGLAVALRLRLLVTPHRTLPPSSGFPPEYSHPSEPGAPVVREVTDGLNSSTSPRRSSVRPTRCPDCPRNDELARLAGAHESSAPECCTWRVMLMPQRCSAAGWKRRLLNGIRTSTSYP